MASQIVSSQTVQKLIEQGALLVDIRSSSEYDAAHIESAVNMPIAQLHADALSMFGNRDIIFYCHSGGRTKSHADKLATFAKGNSFILEGGLLAWEKAGFNILKGEKGPIELNRQIQIVAGSLVVLGITLGVSINAWFYLLAFFVGAGLVFAGVTGFCGMGILLMKMPWNRTK